MFELRALFFVTMVTCNLLVGFDQNNYTSFQPNVWLNSPYDPREQSKPAVRLSYGGCTYIPEPYRLPAQSGSSSKKSTKKPTVQKNIAQLRACLKTKFS